MMDEAPLEMLRKRAIGRLLDEREAIVRDAVGLAFRQTIRVRIARPRWMPDRLYRWLMRTIVVESGPIR